MPPLMRRQRHPTYVAEAEIETDTAAATETEETHERRPPIIRPCHRPGPPTPPAAPVHEPTAVMKWRPTPRLIVNPRPTVVIDPNPSAILIRSQTRPNLRSPCRAVAGIDPVSIPGEIFGSVNVGRYVLTASRLEQLTVTLARPLIELIESSRSYDLELGIGFRTSCQHRLASPKCLGTFLAVYLDATRSNRHLRLAVCSY
jgi:hypothetical protein